MALITPDRLIELKAKVKAECQRRCNTGSVSQYAGEDYDFTITPESGKVILKEHYEKIAIPLNAIVGGIPTDGNRIVREIEIADFESKVEELVKISETSSTTNCAASCTGLCQGGCASGCSGCSGCGSGCSGGCSGCGGSCSSGCGSGCSSGCTATCANNCSGGCSGSCTGGCTNACSGTCTGCSSCTGSCVSVAADSETFG